MVSMLGLVCLSIYFKRWFYKRHTQLSVRMNAQWIGIHCDWRLQFMWNVTACTVNMLWSHCDVRWTTLAECVFRSDITLWFHYETHIWSSMMSSILMMPCQRGPCDARENKSLLCPYRDPWCTYPWYHFGTPWGVYSKYMNVLPKNSRGSVRPLFSSFSFYFL